MIIRGGLLISLVCSNGVFVRPVCGQTTLNELPAPSASLYGRFAAEMTLENTSLFYQPALPPKTLKLHDFVTVIINENAQVNSEGEMQRRKNALYDARLTDWILLKGFSLTPDPQSGGDPRVRGQLDSQLRATSELETGNSMRFTIHCRIVDVRPNGNLVIEGHSHIRDNEDTWIRKLSGIIDPDDVSPAGTILSEKVAEIQITKEEEGYVRDGYRRGWFARFFDKVQPF